MAESNVYAELGTHLLNVVGYECEFVDEPPKEIQTKCPICLFILREPFQATCCGHSFCQACIQKIQQEHRPCPTCNQPRFNVFPNKGLQRTLFNFKVECMHKKLGCEWVGELNEMEKHVRKPTSLCPGNAVYCDFRYAGCDAQLPRREMPAHLKDEATEHLSLLAKHSRRMDDKLQRLEQQTAGLRSVLATVFHLPEFCIENYSNFKENNLPWYSRPFYASSEGYKLMLRVDVNGTNDAKGSHISAWFYLMKGEFDHNLTWPFAANITIQILAQDGTPLEGVVPVTQRDASTMRVLEDERSKLAFGKGKLIAHNQLKPRFTKNNRLCFKISKVELSY